MFGPVALETVKKKKIIDIMHYLAYKNIIKTDSSL